MKAAVSMTTQAADETLTRDISNEQLYALKCRPAQRMFIGKRGMWRIVVASAFAVGVAGLPEGKQNEAQLNLEQERECGKQAARVFNEQWKEFAQGHDRWESHHNSKLNRCLLKVLSPGDPWSVVVVDADTRHVLAGYSGNWPPKIEAFDRETNRYRTPICKKNRDGDRAECETYAVFEKLVAEQFGFAPDGSIK